MPTKNAPRDNTSIELSASTATARACDRIAPRVRNSDMCSKPVRFCALSISVFSSLPCGPGRLRTKMHSVRKVARRQGGREQLSRKYGWRSTSGWTVVWHARPQTAVGSGKCRCRARRLCAACRVVCCVRAEPEPEPEPDLLLTKSKLCARAQAAARALTSSESDATYTLATPYLSRSRSACARYSCGTAVHAGP